jgi:ElaB/YqjD/DUF883 family membrane-anchored ribosome-binding protein
MATNVIAKSGHQPNTESGDKDIGTNIFMGATKMVEKQQNDSAESTRLEAEVAALKADMARLREDIANLTAALGATASDYANDARDEVQKRAAEARNKAAEQLNQAADAGRQAVDNLEEKIVQKPIASLVTAATIGFIFAKLLDLGGRR